MGRSPRSPRHHIFALAALVAFSGAVLAGCGDDDAVTSASSSTSTAPDSTAPGSTTTPTTVGGLDQPAIWPAPEVVFDAPEEAAQDFVRLALGVEPELGEFLQGDSRSGEMELMVRPEGASPVPRGVLFLRQIGPTDGWYVLGAASEGVTISRPESMAEVPAADLVVSGVARGFEANVNVSAFVAGDATRLDEQITFGGSAETPEPFEVTLDLSGASPGDVVTILVRGGVGLENDPGEIGAVPVVIAG